MRPQRFYVYKCVNDDGGAPCVHDELLSLAICKPQIRRTVRAGDFVFAFGANREKPANRLIYIAVVAAVPPAGDYYDTPEYQDRSDCIYERRPGGIFQLRPDARFHHRKDNRDYDLGAHPDYPRANVIVATDFRYFGGSGSNEWKATSPNLAKMVEALGQGHRVYDDPDDEIYQELVALKERTWMANRLKVLGKPLAPPWAEQCVPSCTTAVKERDTKKCQHSRC